LKHYIEVYCEYFGYGEQDVILCEIPECSAICADLHHIFFRGMGGRKTYILDGKEYDIDGIENLIAVYRKDHEKSHASIHSKEYLRAVHKQTMENHL